MQDQGNSRSRQQWTGVYDAGSQWWFRITPEPGAPQQRVYVSKADYPTQKDVWLYKEELSGRAPGEVLNVHSNIRFREFAQDVIENRRPKANIRTRGHYHGLIERYVETPLLRMKVRDVRAEHVRKYVLLSMRKRGLAGKTIGQTIDLVKAVFDEAERDGIRRDNPVRRLSPNEKDSRQPQNKQRMLTENERGNYLNEAIEKYQAVIAVMLLAGLRISEALGLQWGDIDWEAHELHVARQVDPIKRRTGVVTFTDTKTEQAVRSVPMSDELEQILRRHMKAVRVPFGKARLFELSHNAIQQYVVAHARRQGLVREGEAEKLTPHTLRHNYGSDLLHRGVPLTIVSKYMGHANVKITAEVYSHVTDDSAAKALVLRAVNGSSQG